jgi:hypothetical protein
VTPIVAGLTILAIVVPIFGLLALLESVGNSDDLR